MSLIPQRPEITLGRKASDIVTGYRGTITAVTARITGQVELLLEAQADLPNGREASRWVELSRIRVDGTAATVTLAAPAIQPGFFPQA